MAPLAPNKKRRVAFEDESTNPEPVNEPKKKKRRQQQAEKSLARVKASSGNTSKAPPSENLSFKVIAGSYEKILYGLEGLYDKDTGKATLKPAFIFPAHLSCIKTVATSPGGKWLATGAADEVIKIWDLRRRKEVGGLIQHEGSITQLSFPTRSHMFSASEDGTITVFQVKDWIPVRSLKGHKGRVNDIAIHPSFKVALSVGKDKVLRMWDLSKGKSVASVKIGKEGETIRWSSNGTHFAILAGSSIEIYSTDMKVQKLINHPSRLHALRFLKLSDGRECLLIAAEDKKVSVYSFDNNDASETMKPPYATFTGHSNRVKSIDLMTLPLEDGASKVILLTVSSDGFVNLYDTTILNDRALEEADGPISIEPIGSYDTKGTRLTCATFADYVPAKTVPVAGHKRPLSEDEDEDLVAGSGPESS